jgi:tetratricopeptide (TPR) repeat protein
MPIAYDVASPSGRAHRLTGVLFSFNILFNYAMCVRTDPGAPPDLFDEAEKAVADDDLEVALGNVNEALELVPNEPRFHGLKGDIMVYQRRYREALTNYDQALAIDSNYFDYYLGRGVANARLNNRAAARSDLEQSAKLLPTAIAMNELGKIALTDGDRVNAKQYFQQAAQAQGQIGQEATAAFISLDVADNPASYVSAVVFADQGGRIIARVSNRSPVQLGRIEVEFAAVISGSIRRQRVAVPALPANAYQDVGSGLRFPEGTTWTQDMMNAQVVAAGL